VRDQPEIIRDFHMPRPDKGPIMGRVTFEGKGVAGASVEFFSDGPGGGDTSRAKTDIEGRFSTMRWLDRSAVHAKSADGSLGAVVDIGEEDPEVMIELAPTAIATGTVLDETGKPASDRLLSCPRVTYHDGQAFWSEPVAPKVVTDDRGHFTLPSLVVGQRYEIVLEGGNGRLLCGRVRAEKSDHINLGILRAGAYSPPELINRREISAFTEDAPDAGRTAPPIAATTLDGKPLSLDDFKGRYVLLDFWATWCGPCIKEIPQLQSVYDAFGKDERFAIVSLSIDEKIDQPKEFQEARKLPWTQAFIGQEIHGPIPQSFGVRAIPAFVLIGPEGKIVARGMRGEEIKAAVSKVLASP
jgi:thiol-disulfide isomerase/thioredoxin